MPGYTSSTIATIINKLNTDYFLPAIQRPFVYTTDQIITLFDSLMKGYPISSFLFWELQPKYMGQWDIYKFLMDFTHGDTHNEIYGTEDIDRPLTLVLDGQQRLTSLMIGLKGSYIVRVSGVNPALPNAWIQKNLYIDLLKDSNAQDNVVAIAVSYGFGFFENHPNNSINHYWIKVGDILDYTDKNYFYRDIVNKYLNDLAVNVNVTDEQRVLFRLNLEQLWRVVWQDECLNYYTETSQSYEKVLDIFIRANDCGTKLSKSDLLLSMLVANWTGGKEIIVQFVKKINNKLVLKNKFTKDFVMKSCLVLLDLPHTYNVRNFTTDNLRKIQDNWVSIANTIERTIRLVNSFGIDKNFLTSTNALHPIAYYLHKANKGLAELHPDIVKQIHRWLLIASLNSVFSGTSDQAIGDSRTIIQEEFNDNFFPIERLLLELSIKGKHTCHPRLNDDFVNEIMSLTDNNTKEAFLAASLIQDGVGLGAKFDVDHIFPRSWFTLANLRQEGITKVEEYTSNSMSIVNLQILPSTEYHAKKTKSPSIWFNNLSDNDFKKKHCLPLDPSLYQFENFLAFIKARKQLIKEKLEGSFF
jgi:Protein of unknown function DUF262